MGATQEAIKKAIQDCAAVQRCLLSLLGMASMPVPKTVLSFHVGDLVMVREEHEEPMPALILALHPERSAQQCQVLGVDKLGRKVWTYVELGSLTLVHRFPHEQAED